MVTPKLNILEVDGGIFMNSNLREVVPSRHAYNIINEFHQQWIVFIVYENAI